MKTVLRTILLLAGGCAVGFVFSTCGTSGRSGGSATVGGDVGAALTHAVLPSPAFAKTTGREMSLADISEQTVPSVVNIASEKVIRHGKSRQQSPFFSDPFFRHFFGQPFGGPQIPHERRQKSLGSGVIVSANGTILTNSHVVEKADKIQVTLSDGREFDAEVVGTDPKSDVAVLKLKGDVKGLAPAEFGDSDRLRLGDIVLAIGNPFGVGQTVTMGIISAKGRADIGIVDYEDFIQTDAAINPGNSGGALINTEGKLVGINTAIVSRTGGYQGIGFAIPSNMAKIIMDSLLNNGKVVRGWLGVAIQDVNQDLAEAMGLESNKGVLIADVTEDSPAQKAGLKRGDVVLKLDGEVVDSTGKLRNLVSIAGPAKEVQLEIRRDTKTMTVKVKLAAIPADLGGVAEIEAEESVLGGLKVGTLNPVNREKFELPKRMDHGVVVLNVERGSRAMEAGFRPGDVILELDRHPVKSVGAFTQLYKKAKARILLLVYRRGSTLFLVLSKEH